jgi:hypothetical protein
VLQKSLSLLVQVLGVGILPSGDPFEEASFDVDGFETECTDLMVALDLINVVLEVGELLELFLEVFELWV